MEERSLSPLRSQSPHLLNSTDHSEEHPGTVTPPTLLPQGLVEGMEIEDSEEDKGVNTNRDQCDESVTPKESAL